MLLSEAFELYRLNVIAFNNQSAKTEEMNGLVCKSLVKYLGDIELTTLTFDHVRKWKEDLTKTKGANTVRGYVIKLRVMLKSMRLMGHQCMNYELIGVPKRKSTAVQFLTPNEVEQLISCVFAAHSGYNTLNRYRNRAIISLLYASGIRVSELCSLNKLSIREDNSFTIIGKGDKTRLCFIDSRTAGYIHEYLDLRHDRNPALFLSHQTGERAGVGIIQMMFRHASEKTGYDKQITPHILRHSFATNLLRNNTNLAYVQKFLGHSNIQTTTIYTHVVDEDLRSLYAEKHTT